MNTPKPLAQYKKNGFQWELVTRQSDVGLFQHRSQYEVILIQSHNGREIAGVNFPPAEYPPSNEQWGSKGWSFSNIDDAFNKFYELALSNKSKSTEPHAN